MAKKFSKVAAEAEAGLLGTVKESSSQIWLAGLGAFSKAQEEGKNVFEALVKEGMGLQKKFKKFADGGVSQVGEAANEMSSKITEASSKAAGAWDRLESVFEERVGRAVNRLGVPSKADINELIKRLDALTNEVEKLNGKKAPAARSASAKAKLNKTTTPAVRKAVKTVKAVKRAVKRAVK